MNEEEQKAYKKVVSECDCKYKEAYNILMDYWDSLPDEEKPIIDKALKKLGL